MGRSQGMLRLGMACLLLVLASRVWAQPVVEVTPDFDRLDLTPHLEILEDVEGELDFDAARRATGYAPVPAAGPNFGFSTSVWWVRFAVHNTGSEPAVLLLRQDYPLIDHLDLWLPDGRGGTRHLHTGDRKPFASRDIDLRNFVSQLVVPAGETVPVLLRYATGGSMDISLKLFAPVPLLEQVGVEQLAYGIYYGGFIALIFYNLIIFVAVRDRVFFWYLLYAVVFGLHFGVHNGFSYQFLWPNSPAWANQSLVVLLGLSLIFALQFTRGFLDAQRMLPRCDRIAQILQAMAGLIVLGSFVLPYGTVVVPIAHVTILVTALILFMGTRSLLAGYRPARYFMLAWIAMLLTVFAYMLKAFGILPNNVLTQNGFQIGSLLEMTLLSVALSARVRDLQKYSFTDPLTGLLNRRSFDQHLELEFLRGRQGGPVSLLVIDIDHFKRFNDSHGHAAGDKAIRLVARHLDRNLRPGDAVYRYGGEEFAAILPGADLDQARDVAQRLLGPVDSGGITDDPITLSIGVACSDGLPEPVAARLFELADQALYQAKTEGRHRAVAAT
ncbi:diguanylate cyclase [Pseudofulvimonas gallinarii]|uniref:diguanylate cyclase n=3 Tax=Pseudofulvimonas gallinarii TaxID=634155 RepID=A0A4R3L100_9GAMM|nr:diguanylate cyclase [Pseudofulvimonas gallinarii]TCS93201.1 diguanylate cyclase (GGDEF)-like protein [Pseudofulvimonas gallinarii]